MHVDLELWNDGDWELAGRIEALTQPDRGHLGKVAFEYQLDYATKRLDATGSRAISCRYLPSFELWIEEPWPAFVFDILPAGAARRSMIARLGIRDTARADWQLLQLAQFPPGNLRVRAEPHEPRARHGGFDRDEVIARGAEFVEYAFERGAPVAGSTGAQGEAPKFLLNEDTRGRWHADGAIGDSDVARHWLVKFPRGRHESDFTVLAEEARYMELAREAGLRANARMHHEAGCLFVPRFDRVAGGRLGLETIASLSGISGYGVTQPLQESARAIAEHCTDPAGELRELLLRDVLNLAVGNTDNHVRNTSVLKYPDGRVELSPIYDLAPMILDRAGIVRTGRWKDREQSGSIDWSGVVADLEMLGADAASLREALRAMAQFVDSLSDRMTRAGVDASLVARLAVRQSNLAKQIAEACR